MYKLTKVTDRNGNIKNEAISQMKAICPDLSGEIPYKESIAPGKHFCFLWTGESGRMMRTSTIEHYKENGPYVHVVTRNSEYWFKEVSEE
ncbi:hypothetical protein K413DRAFT_3010 [Clostridium sp. ASBs410]|nr:hypothetical protein K413DRAFT_3010 [Clostridium sp. ASBs410]